MDRADLQFATKEVCRGMSKPKKADNKKMKRLNKYLKQIPRAFSRRAAQRVRPIHVKRSVAESAAKRLACETSSET